MINKLKQYKFIVFDCDGVILDSNKIKSDAFAKALENEKESLVREFIQYHKDHGGVSRYKKFEYFFNHIKAESTVTKDDYNNALTKYASIVEKGMRECSYINGVLDLLVQLNNANIPLYVVSGSDEKELRRIFETRNIDHFFTSIYGSPNNKVENLKKIESLRGPLNNGLIFGDSKSDMLAAEYYNLDFIYIYEKSEWSTGKSDSSIKNYPQYLNFFELLN